MTDDASAGIPCARMVAKDLLLLALIRRGAVSGYALRRAVRSHAVLYAAFDHGNVLYRLRRMQDEGVIEARIERGASGPRRERTLYAITPEGEARYDELLVFRSRRSVRWGHSGPRTCCTRRFRRSRRSPGKRSICTRCSAS
jgi:DNA-binding PadR family transcriptional regulator